MNAMTPQPLVLREIPQPMVEPRNALFRRREPASFRISGRGATLTLRPSAGPADLEQGLYVRFTIDRKPGWLLLERAVVAELMESFDDGAGIARMSPGTLALALECALAPSLGELERSLRARITLSSVSAEAPQDAEGFLVSFSLQLHGEPSSSCELRLPGGYVEALAGLLGDGLHTEAAEELFFPVRICTAAVDLTISELRSLGAGDVVVVSDGVPEGAALAVIGDHLIYRISSSSEDFKIVSSARLVRGSAWEWSMQSSGSSNGSDREDLDQLPVHLTFELGRLEMPLSEVRTLGSGSVLPLARPTDRGVDIVANGRRVGRGTLVKIGESVGVEIVRMFDAD